MKEGREEVGDDVSWDPSVVFVGRMTSSSAVGITTSRSSSSAASEEPRDMLDRRTALPKSWASVRSARSMLRSE